MDNMSLLTV